MTKKEFQPKGEETIRQEVASNYNLDPEENGELIDKIVEDKLKDENFKASEKKKNVRLKTELKNQLKAKEYYKKGGKSSKGDKQPKGENGQKEASNTDQKLETLIEIKEEFNLSIQDAKKLIKDAEEAGVNALNYENPIVKTAVSNLAEQIKSENAMVKSKSKQIEEMDFSSVDLDNKEHTKWLSAKPGRRKKYMDWLVEH